MSWDATATMRRMATPETRDDAARHDGEQYEPMAQVVARRLHEQIVVLRPHSGARVAVLDFEECLDIYKIRERLEPLAFSESVGRLDDAQLAEVRRPAEQMESLTGDHGAWLTADRAFHLACYAGVSTPRILRMIVGFWNTTQHYRRVLLRTFTDHDFRLAHDEHRLMIDALETGDARRGEDIVRMAMERSRLRLTRHRELFDR
jgi:DNA-binding GntR family transcriptional regulator